MPENLIGIIVFAVIFIIIALILGYTIRIVPQAEAYVVERLGAYSATWTTGVHFVMPFVDRIANKLTLKEIVKDFDPQPVITTLPCRSIPLYTSRLLTLSCIHTA